MLYMYRTCLAERSLKNNY